jgi:hypothetical protein
MLTPAKQSNMLLALKSYKKKFLDRDLIELDESGTRLLVNSFHSGVLDWLFIDDPIYYGQRLMHVILFKCEA